MLLEPLDDRLRLDRFFLQPVVDRRLQAEHRVDALLQALDVPLLGIGARRAMDGDQGRDGLGAHIGDDVADMLGIHDLGALLVDDLALVVHHVVEFDDLLADVVVARLDLLLGGLDRLGDPRADDRLAVLEILVHQPREGVCGPKMRSKSSSRLR